jgi:hypothetical protein
MNRMLYRRTLDNSQMEKRENPRNQTIAKSILLGQLNALCNRLSAGVFAQSICQFSNVLQHLLPTIFSKNQKNNRSIVMKLFSSMLAIIATAFVLSSCCCDSPCCDPCPRPCCPPPCCAKPCCPKPCCPAPCPCPCPAPCNSCY